ncbi:MAG TPA: integration host factor subunit beta [Thermoanaerobaculia bacterium]|nr:integration host factor subunit beta [Thermoanaerobaculia bacterium]
MNRESDVDLNDSPKPGVMTKAELVDEVAQAVQLTKKQAETIVNIVFDSIVGSLRSGEKIELRGFGSFRLRSRKSRTGRNPKTGEKVDVPSKRIPYFKPGKELKELINQQTGQGDGAESVAVED